MPQAAEPRLILASGSATRAGLLRGAGVAFEVVVVAVDEDGVKRSAQAEGAGAEETAVLLAEMKAARVSRRHPGALVIGADQILVCGAEWFDKPGDLAEARGQLLRLRGRGHRLATAVVCMIGGVRVWHDVASPVLTMRDFSEGFLDSYLRAEGSAVLATVGAYRLEGMGVQLFDRVEGEFAAVLGLPLLAVLGFLRQRGVLPG